MKVTLDKVHLNLCLSTYNVADINNNHFKRSPHTHWHTSRGLTSREGELNLLVDDLHGDEVVFFVESSVVEEQSVSLSGSKPAEIDGDATCGIALNSLCVSKDSFIQFKSQK